MHADRLRLVEVEEVVRESPSIYTIRYRDDRPALPGQFVMVWLPGVNEVPMSLSYTGEDKGFTFRPVGETTKALAALEPGAPLGIRGIFGNSFKLTTGSALIVGGGTGIASIIAAVEPFSSKARVHAALGARTADELFFEKRVEESGAVLHVATDDGSRGHHGLVTDVVRKLLESGGIGQVIACGPERMLRGTAVLGREFGIPGQYSVERFMKCGIGICDACSLDGRLVCNDGPVFDGDFLLDSEDFGRYRLAPDGRRVTV